MKKSLFVLLASAILIAIACGGSQTKKNFDKFNSLSVVDKAPFNGCTKVDNVQVRDMQACKKFPILDQRYQDCVAAVKGHYADLPDLGARMKWLNEQGCPVKLNAN